MPPRLISMIPFIELRRYRTPGGKERVVILREDGRTETLWADEVAARLGNQQIAKQKTSTQPPKP